MSQERETWDVFIQYSLEHVCFERTCNPKMGMKDVHHVAWPISDTARLWILSGQNKLNELLTVDPTNLVQDG